MHVIVDGWFPLPFVGARGCLLLMGAHLHKFTVVILWMVTMALLCVGFGVQGEIIEERSLSLLGNGLRLEMLRCFTIACSAGLWASGPTSMQGCMQHWLVGFIELFTGGAAVVFWLASCWCPIVSSFAAHAFREFCLYDLSVQTFVRGHLPLSRHLC